MNEWTLHVGLKIELKIYEFSMFSTYSSLTHWIWVAIYIRNFLQQCSAYYFHSMIPCRQYENCLTSNKAHKFKISCFVNILIWNPASHSSSMFSHTTAQKKAQLFRSPFSSHPIQFKAVMLFICAYSTANTSFLMLLIMKLLLIMRALNEKSLSFFQSPLSAQHNNSSTVYTITPLTML